MRRTFLGMMLIVGFWAGASAQPELDKSARKKLDAAIRDSFMLQSCALEPLNDSVPVYRILSQDILHGYSFFGQAKGRFESFDFVILYSADLIIRSVEILVYRSDHGYEIMNKKWLSRFSGTGGCDLIYGKEIDALSGATISATSLTEAVADCCNKIHLLIFPTAQSDN